MTYGFRLQETRFLKLLFSFIQTQAAIRKSPTDQATDRTSGKHPRLNNVLFFYLDQNVFYPLLTGTTRKKKYNDNDHVIYFTGLSSKICLKFNGLKAGADFYEYLKSIPSFKLRTQKKKKKKKLPAGNRKVLEHSDMSEIEKNSECEQRSMY